MSYISSRYVIGFLSPSAGHDSEALVASADIVTVTYAGTVSEGEDFTGVFGTPLEMFATSQPAHTLVFSFNTAVGSLTTTSTSQRLIGGSSQPPGTIPSPGSAVLSINGISVSEDGSYLGKDLAFGITTNSGMLQQSAQYAAALGYEFSGGVSSTDMTRFPVNVTTNGTYTIIPSDIIGPADINFFSINLGDNVSNASGEFTPATVTVSDVSAVPPDPAPGRF